MTFDLGERPRFELRRVMDDGTCDEPRVVPLADIDPDCRMDRRGFVGTGVTVAAALASLAGCASP